ncbi:MAG: hypothetical protein IKD23_03885 [Lentisphaeria bacterium]|nr:hypothetical protein [Lentisphaeria bacterium]
MRRAILLILCLFFLKSTAGLREVAFYKVSPTNDPPVLDGKLDEQCWKNAEVLSRYWQYGKPNPPPSPLKTEFRAVYHTDGLYVGIVNYDDQIELLHKNFQEDDNIDLWRDDCAELYFDPEANGIGHTIFTVNPAGVKADRKRLDTVVYLWDWNGLNWQTSASIAKDRWTLELFFSWEDLGKKANPGDLWQFLHTRYAWKNRFIGAASAAGADSRVTENFGYLFFSGKTPVTPQKTAEIMQGKVQIPCILLAGNDLICFSETGTRIEPMEKVVKDAWTEYTALLREIKGMHHGQIPGSCRKTVENCEKLHGDISLATYRLLEAAKKELFKLKWECLLDLHFNLPEGDKAK